MGAGGDRKMCVEQTTPDQEILGGAWQTKPFDIRTIFGHGDVRKRNGVGRLLTRTEFPRLREKACRRGKAFGLQKDQRVREPKNLPP